MKIEENVYNCKNAGIYAIHNITNGKYYIGKSTNIKNRICSHIGCLKRNKHHCEELQEDYNAGNNIQFELLEIVKNPKNSAILLFKEQHYINQYDSIQHGYNTFKSGESISRKYVYEYNADVKKEIRIMLADNGISQAELARRLNQTPANFNNKMQKANFRISEMEEIADALGYEYKASFKKKTN